MMSKTSDDIIILKDCIVKYDFFKEVNGSEVSVMQSMSTANWKFSFDLV